jgi:hypothetical protein
MHSEELHEVYASPDIIRAMNSRRTHGEVRNVYTILVGKPEPLGRHMP